MLTWIEGLSPAISQLSKNRLLHNPRSTVGTVTEIHDYLRLLFARAGDPECPDHGIKLVSTNGFTNGGCRAEITGRHQVAGVSTRSVEP